MSLAVREVDVLSEKALIASALARELPDWKDDGRFEWAYLANPLGRARSWVLEDDEGCVHGVASAFPRGLLHSGRKVTAWVLGDFFVSRSLRALGPALSLQRAVNEAVGRGEVEAWYDFPSRAMLAVHRRLGVRRCEHLHRLVYPLKVGDYVRDRIGEGVLTEGLERVGNAVLRARAPKTSTRVTRVETPDWESVALPHGPKGGVTVNRTAKYLHWRYQAGVEKFGTLLACQSDGRLGLLVFRDGSELFIADVLAEDEKLIQELVSGAIALAQEGGARAVVTSISQEHPWLTTFERLGFSRRDSVPFTVFGAAVVTNDQTPWFLMGGDRDY